MAAARLPPVSEAQLAAVVGVVDRTVRRWIESGLPAKKRGRTLRIDLAAAIHWIRERDREEFEARLTAATSSPDIDVARARKMAAEADMAEMERDRKRGGLVPQVDVEERWAEMMVSLREAVMGVPGVAVQSGLIQPTAEADLERICRDALGVFGARRPDA